MQNYKTIPDTVYHKEQKDRPSSPMGKTPIYDFDEWSRAHYGTMFARDMAIKRAMEFRKQQRRAIRNDIKSEKIMLMMLLMMGICMYYSLENNDIDYIADNSVPQTSTTD